MKDWRKEFDEKFANAYLFGDESPVSHHLKEVKAFISQVAEESKKETKMETLEWALHMYQTRGDQFEGVLNKYVRVFSTEEKKGMPHSLDGDIVGCGTNGLTSKE